MGLVLRCLFGLSVLVIGIAYYANPVYPDTASNRGMKQVTGLYIKLVNVVRAIGGSIGFSNVNIFRAMMHAPLSISSKLDTIDEMITTVNGVEVTIYKPATPTSGLRPGIIHYHGGGWVLFEPVHYAPICRALANLTQSVVISVNYRRAPEYLFPAAIDDCVKATKYIMTHAEEFGIDSSKIGVKGDSSGGNLAMATALEITKDTTLQKLKFMSLDYPAVQAFNFVSLPSYSTYEIGPSFLDRPLMVEYWLLYAFGHLKYYQYFYHNQHISSDLEQSKYAEYVSTKLLPENLQTKTTEFHVKKLPEDKKILDEVQKIILNPRFAPLMASDEDIAGLPSTYIINAEFDVLRDEGFLVAERLRMAGVSVEHSFVPTEEHGFLNLVEFDKYSQKEHYKFARYFNKTVGLGQ